MTAPVVAPTFPALRTLGLSDGERATVARLRQKLNDDQRAMHELDLYYNGEQAMTTLGISLPPELTGLRTVVGWPRLAVDPLHERLDIEGFRYPDSDDADQAMWEVWQRNNLDEEAPLAFLDALVLGRAYVVVGSGDDGVPLVTVESPFNLAVEWDVRSRQVRTGLQMYSLDGQEAATLLLPDETIEMVRDDRGSWIIENRDRHNMGWPPVLPMVNRSRVHDRRGRSEITPEVRQITDAACRAMLRMEVGAEFFSTPQRYIVGAAMEDFQDVDGNVKAAWESYIGQWLVLERDGEDKPPQVGTFQAGDPSVHTQVLNYYGKQIASLLGLPASYVGESSDNPASADAIRMSTDRLVQKAKRKHRAFEGALEGAMRAALAFQQGVVPDMAQLIETIWRRPEIPTPAATTDSVTKQMQAGYLPAQSDVAGEALGYTPLQRSRIANERKREQASSAASAILARAGAAQNPPSTSVPPQTTAGTPGVPPERASGDQQPRPGR